MLTRFGALLLFFSAAVAGASHAVAADISYVGDANGMLDQPLVVVDARSAAACTRRSLAGAHCLPARDFFGPHGRLAGFADIAWLLGSAGLQGNEQVLVVGDSATERDFVAGILYLMGQARISILTQAVSRGAGLAAGRLGAGVPRASTRIAVYQAAARAQQVIFKHELAALLASPSAPVVLDGRSEQEYWGERIRAQRGGHIPGADHWPAAVLRGAVARGDGLAPAATNPVVYAHNALEGIAYFSLVHAGLGVYARVYPGGWAEWAADGALGADAASYPEVAAPMPAQTAPVEEPLMSNMQWESAVLGGFAGAALLAILLFFLPRMSPRANSNHKKPGHEQGA